MSQSSYQVLRFGLKFHPLPTLALEYRLSEEPERLLEVSLSAEELRKDASVLMQQLSERHAELFHPTVVSSEQVFGLLRRLQSVVLQEEAKAEEKGFSFDEEEEKALGSPLEDKEIADALHRIVPKSPRDDLLPDAEAAAEQRAVLRAQGLEDHNSRELEDEQDELETPIEVRELPENEQQLKDIDETPDEEPEDGPETEGEADAGREEESGELAASWLPPPVMTTRFNAPPARTMPEPVSPRQHQGQEEEENGAQDEEGSVVLLDIPDEIESLDESLGYDFSDGDMESDNDGDWLG